MFWGYQDVSFDGVNTAFKGYGTAGEVGVYSDLGGLHAVADLSTPIPGGTGNFTGVARPVIGSGNVAFVGYGTSDQRGVYVDMGGGLSVVANKTTPVPGGTGTFTSFSDTQLSISSDGQTIAFFGRRGTTYAGYYASTDGSLRVVADKNTPIPGGTGNFAYFDGLSADDDAAAFNGGDAGAGDQEGIYLDMGGLTLIADRDTLIPGSTQHFHGFGPAALDNGNVAFGGGSADLTEGGIYAYYEGTLLKVIEGGDLLDGQSILSMSMSTEALDGDQLAFWVQFTDNSQAIYVATIPEPGTLALLALGALTLARRRR